MIIISAKYSNKNNFYILEGFTNFFLSVIFFTFRKIYDFLLRINFAEKFKFENYYNYTINYINSLSCFHVNFNKDNIYYIDKYFQNFLVNTNPGMMSSNDQEKIEYTSCINDNKIPENKKILNRAPTYKDLISIEGDYKIINDFTKKLVPLEDLYCFSEKNHFDDQIKEKFNENNLDANETNDYLIKNFKEKLNLIKDDSDHKIGSKNEITLFSILESLKHKLFTKKESKKIQNFIKLGIFTFKNEENNMYFQVFIRRVKYDFILKNEIKNETYDLLFQDISDLIQSKKKIHDENLIKQKILAKIAHEFKTPINSIIGLINNVKEDIINFTFDKKINDEQKLDHYQQYDDLPENYRNKNLNIIKYFDCNNFSKKRRDDIVKIEKSLSIIENLSKYVIILISDIIHFSMIQDFSQVNSKICNFSLSELAFFVYEILNCLLECNTSKRLYVKAELVFDDKLKNVYIKSDETRIKQILLNIISNSIKFTKQGKIILSFIMKENSKEVIILVEDTGIGIKDEDKDKLFRDFVMLETGSNYNKQGSGLGLSICKSLGSKLNIKLNFESVYGEGSKFYVYLPYEKNSYKIEKTVDNKLPIEQIDDKNLKESSDHKDANNLKEPSELIESILLEDDKDYKESIEPKKNIDQNFFSPNNKIMLSVGSCSNQKNGNFITIT